MKKRSSLLKSLLAIALVIAAMVCCMSAVAANSSYSTAIEITPEEYGNVFEVKFPWAINTSYFFYKTKAPADGTLSVTYYSTSMLGSFTTAMGRNGWEIEGERVTGQKKTQTFELIKDEEFVICFYGYTNGDMEFVLCFDGYHQATGEPAIVQRPTCTAAGMKASVCGICGAYMNIEELPMIDHEIGSWEVDVEAGCDTAGARVRRCVACGLVMEQEEIEAMGHDIPEEPFITVATCTVDGVSETKCIRCGEVFSSEIIPAEGHVEGETRVITKAGCMTPGEQEVYCMNCGTLIDTQLIPVGGHAWSEWSVDVAPTTTAGGYQSRFCTVCGEQERFDLPKLSE